MGWAINFCKQKKASRMREAFFCYNFLLKISDEIQHDGFEHVLLQLSYQLSHEFRQKL